MGHSDKTILSLCSGVGMLDEGIRAGLEFLGIPSRTVAYAEWDAYAASRLLDRMEEGSLDEAPVWCGDLGKLDFASFRGVVDIIAAGFPCQPHSMAGMRKGIEDERWIWPDIANGIRLARPEIVFLENVPGLRSSGGLAPVLADLAEMGFRVEWGSVTAKSVGASHERERVFILAKMGNAGLQQQYTQQWAEGPEYSGASRDVANTDILGRDEGRPSESPQRRDTKTFGSIDSIFSYSCCQGRQQIAGSVPEHARIQAWTEGYGGGNDFELECDGENVADSRKPGSQGRELGESFGKRNGKIAYGSTSEFCEIPLFAPGPSDPRWGEIIESFPWLAPAVESSICGMVDGMAVVVDESRADQLRCIGNGVVPAQAAVAFVELAWRIGIAQR